MMFLITSKFLTIHLYSQELSFNLIFYLSDKKHC